MHGDGTSFVVDARGDDRKRARRDSGRWGIWRI